MSAWVIECYINSVLRYWDGNAQTPRLTSDYDRAIKFADEASASRVLAYLLEGNGRVAQHGYIESKP